MDSSHNEQSSPKLVTIGVPIYKRLEYLPSVLKMIGEQEYPAIELIVSDNGQNGRKVHDIVEALYTRRPHHVRENASTVNINQHFNQIIAESSGDYYITLNDDDEITPNYVAELVHAMEMNPGATLAMSRQETIDEGGAVLRQSKDELPPLLTGPAFIRAMWQTYEFGFGNVESFLTKTSLLRDTGSYPDFADGNHSDDAAVIRLCINGAVAFGPRATYRHRVHAGGFGWTVTIESLAAATRGFLTFLDEDRTVRRFASTDPEQWRTLREALVRMAWQTYLWRWRDIYRDRLSLSAWVRSAFAMPWLPEYYRDVSRELGSAAKHAMKAVLTGQSQKREEYFRTPAVKKPIDTEGR
jgi:glycosyltransferase involved in cell wall biosynthesis